MCHNSNEPTKQCFNLILFLKVEVSSPNAESESTFCTNSILGSTMCSKLTSSGTASLSTGCSTVTSSQITPIVSSSPAPSNSCSDGKFLLVSFQVCFEFALLVVYFLDTVVCLKPEENPKTTTQVLSSSTVPKNCENNKKREDLTSLGSDDSGKFLVIF